MLFILSYFKLSKCQWCENIGLFDILTSKRMLAERYVLSALFSAWQWIVLLWCALFAFSFKMDLDVDSGLSGMGSTLYSTPAVKTFPKPSIHVICISYPVLMERPNFNSASTNGNDEHSSNSSSSNGTKFK